MGNIGFPVGRGDDAIRSVSLRGGLAARNGGGPKTSNQTSPHQWPASQCRNFKSAPWGIASRPSDCWQAKADEQTW